MILEPNGTQYIQVLKHANVARRILKEQGVKFIDAHVNVNNHKHMLLIVDPEWWTNNESLIVDWCTATDNSLNLTGMILEFDSKEDKMMFMLRW